MPWHVSSNDSYVTSPAYKLPGRDNRNNINNNAMLTSSRPAVHGWVGEDARPALSINLRLQIFQSSEMLTPHQAGVKLPVWSTRWVVLWWDVVMLGQILFCCVIRGMSPVTQSRLVTCDWVRPGQVIWTVHLGIKYGLHCAVEIMMTVIYSHLIWWTGVTRWSGS